MQPTMSHPTTARIRVHFQNYGNNTAQLPVPGREPGRAQEGCQSTKRTKRTKRRSPNGALGPQKVEVRVSPVQGTPRQGVSRQDCMAVDPCRIANT